MRLKPLAVLALALVASLLMAASAQAAVTVSIGPDAKRIKGGRAVNAVVTVTCDPGFEVLEAHLTVSQDNQTITGTGGLGAVQCDGTPHTHHVVVNAQEGRYHRGEAFASAFVLVIDPNTNETQQGQATATINVR
jgi:hypothetical protein